MVGRSTPHAPAPDKNKDQARGRATDGYTANGQHTTAMHGAFCIVPSCSIVQAMPRGTFRRCLDHEMFVCLIRPSTDRGLHAKVHTSDQMYTNPSTHVDTRTKPSNNTTHTVYHKDHARHNNTVNMIPQTTRSKNNNKHQALIHKTVVILKIAVLYLLMH